MTHILKATNENDLDFIHDQRREYLNFQRLINRIAIENPLNLDEALCDPSIEPPSEGSDFQEYYDSEKFN